MAVNFAPNGLVNASVGCHRTIAPGEVWWRRAGRIWWVNGGAVNAVDDGSHGQDPLKPLNTLVYAVNTAASAGDAIIVMQSHAPLNGVAVSNIQNTTPAGLAVIPGEIVSTPILVNKANIAIFGLGSGNANPQFRGPIGGGISGLFNVSADGFELHNVTIWDYAAQFDGGNNINWAITINGGNGALIGEVTFLQGTFTGTGAGVSYTVQYLSGAHWRFENCIFTNKTLKNRPDTQAPSGGIYAPSMTGLSVVNCTFAGGAKGWDVGAMNVTGAVNLKVYGSTLTGNANIFGNASTRGILSGNSFDADSAIVGSPFRFYKTGLNTPAAGAQNPISGPDFACTGSVYWVNNSAANASDSNNGLNEDLPLATLGQAITNVTPSNGDAVVVKTGHSEPLLTGPAGASAPVYTVSKADVKIFGTGNGANRPSFGVTTNAAGNSPSFLFSVSGAGFELHNIQVTPPAVNVGWGGWVSSTGIMTEVEGCAFQLGTLDNGTQAVRLRTSASGGRILNCSFSTTGTNTTLSYFVWVEQASNYYGCVQDNIFDAGPLASGYSVQSFYNGNAAGSNNGFSFLGNTFRNGAYLQITNSVCWVSGTIADASAFVVWSG
jgi:hypothetical protein